MATSSKMPRKGKQPLTEQQEINLLESRLENLREQQRKRQGQVVDVDG